MQSNSPSRYDNEGYSALDIPTSAAVAYLRERAATTAARNTARDQALTEARRLLLVTDATCDLPSAWLRDHNVAVIPVDIRQNDQTTRDFRDEVQCSEFALQLSTSNNRDVLSSEPLQPVQIRDHVQAWMNNDIDNVMQVTFAASRSKHYLSSLAATQSLVLIHNKVRRSMGNRAPLRAWVLDSQTGLTGEALLLAHAVYLRDRGTEAAAIAEAVKQLRGNVHTLLVPGDLRYLYQALQLKGIATCRAGSCCSGAGSISARCFMPVAMTCTPWPASVVRQRRSPSRWRALPGTSSLASAHRPSVSATPVIWKHCSRSPPSPRCVMNAGVAG